MASKHPVDGVEQQSKRRRFVSPTMADVQVKAELDGPIFQDQGRIHSNVQSTASQSTTSQSTTLPSTTLPSTISPSTTSPLFASQSTTLPSIISPSTTSPSSASQPVRLLDWFAEYKSCESFFLDHAQASPYVQALCTYMNIRLPYQKIAVFPPATTFPWLPPQANLWPPPPENLRLPSPRHLQVPPSGSSNSQPVSLVLYIRRLICTGHNTDLILREFFGSRWSSGIGRIHEQEERNYLFAAKSTDWHNVKLAYDISSEETAPFLVSLKEATVEKISDAERDWSEWLAMQDWAVGPRRPLSLDF